MEWLPEHAAIPMASMPANVIDADLKLKRTTRTSKAKRSLGKPTL
jgi:hypothetical protein